MREPKFADRFSVNASTGELPNSVKGRGARHPHSPRRCVGMSEAEIT